MSELRVLYVSPGPYGGSGRVLESSAAALQATGEVKVGLITDDKTAESFLDSWTQRIGSRPTLSPSLRWKYPDEVVDEPTDAKARAELAKCVDQFKPDIIHGRTLLLGARPAVRALRSMRDLGVRAIVHSDHQIDYIPPPPGTFDGYIASSHYEADLKRPADRANGVIRCVIHPVVDEQFSPDAPPDEEIADLQHPRILISGRLSPDKGAREMFDEYGMLRGPRVAPGGRFGTLIVARPPSNVLPANEATHASLLREAGARGFAHELYYLERPLGGNTGCYTASDFTWQFSVPVRPAGRSRAVCYENFGLSYRESFACGRPGLASDVGGLPEGLPPELALRVIARHDEPGHLARLTADLIDNPARARQVAERGAEYVRKDLSSQLHGRLTLEFYREMLARA